MTNVTMILIELLIKICVKEKKNIHITVKMR